MLAWLAALKWKDDPGQVTFLELALDFEAHLDCTLPASPQSWYVALTLSLHECAMVLRLVMAIMHWHVTVGILYPGTHINQSSPLLPLGAGVQAGLTAQPFFACPAV